jgi:hypothetical protein
MLLDHGRLAEIDVCFTADPVVSLFGRSVEGIEAIRALFGERMAGRLTRHAPSPSLIEPADSGGGARCRTYTTVYRAELLDEPGPLAFDGPANFVEYDDFLVRDCGAWRISRRLIAMTFLRR